MYVVSSYLKVLGHCLVYIGRRQAHQMPLSLCTVVREDRNKHTHVKGHTPIHTHAHAQGCERRPLVCTCTMNLAPCEKMASMTKSPSPCFD